MKLERILPFARNLLELAVKPGDIAVDATVGNGHDTLFLANLVGPAGRIYGFDIQDEALMSCKTKLREHEMQDQVTLFHTGHENIAECIPPLHFGKITGAVFNLGYLPGGDKNIVTVPETTIHAIDQLLEIMAPEGIIVIVIYHGHPEGKVEREYLLRYVKSLDQNIAHVLEYKFLNQKNNPPFIIAIEKR
ncbi:16S rRNA (cytosine(1402)-N(4))-methyltransferase [Bacillus sp. ISL-35]|uniref:tRNA (mnm(5)s(2)U34)-methyltransferase n=1 Tax=Bacillus sp. ISL-35 TaxID=2819122 RepID=UPI001BEC4048|nr:class I SAM-dependent methyltransferase [Bacillus sp. ISL-35]MBT2680782.1 16S rRNA (cytosine(1402)-N(4))-methyltransferase [Bacillus sp. ISL-35]MBT2705592.1 16S rRNA (cytosine(1402)-N(4))-methyltransferase [Chryseobacterium sp. ISL-80]